ncbi:MAG TPA: FliH/SctL family protein [Paenalcaligenes sp.]|nr:FliH/SctL family protein [Paenalcaligenes sp.]
MTTSSKQHMNWRPWTMPAMTSAENQKPINRAKNNTEAAHPSAETLRHALEEIQQVRTRATAQGHAQGHKKGLAKGHEQGFQQGVNEGHSKGHKKGFEKGYQEGLKRAQQEAKELELEKINQLHTLIVQATEQLQQLDDTLGEALVSLCCALAERILQQEVQAQNYDLLPLIQRAVRHLTDEQPITVYVHPDDHTVLSKHPEWKSHWQLYADSNLSPCSVVIQAPWGLVDAQLHSRWQEILAALLPEMAHAKADPGVNSLKSADKQ